ncbi:hypothetical protein PMPD1_3078 [Paramixta manurensis]|uniref:Uncharacterized protein n=1 Tax=Paramixta manurensis TaxID=2740817 RepID=A0A6M8UGL4_9GAMM|nr:hypothetical protein PMPD1_3078 [Erwiniaceae bacterium PD-1]
MPIYTNDPGPGINQPISNAPSGLGESLAASFSDGLREGPLMSALRYSEADELANDPNSRIISKGEADARLKELGVKSINIPDYGVTQSYLDHVTEERKESLAKQQIASSAPSGFIATPLNFIAGLAGSMADPANLAIGLVPFAGEAKAASVLGRAGERFLQGAAMGAAQTAATIPFTASASAADGEDYTMANAMENIFLGTVGGGLLHAGGGVIADMVHARRNIAITESPEKTPDTSPPTGESAQVFTDFSTSPRRFGEDGTVPILSEAIARDLDSYAYSRAYDDVAPDYLAQQQSLANARVGNIADLRREFAANQQLFAELDKTLPQRTSDYQQQRMKYKDARTRALRDIEQEKGTIIGRQADIEESLSRNRAAEVASGEVAGIGRGEIPEGLKNAISARADEIKGALRINPVAQGIKNASQRINDAHWSVRQNAFRAGLSHMLQGKVPDIEPVFNLSDPQLRESSMAQIQRGPQADADISMTNASREADSQLKRANQDNADFINAQEDFNSEIELATQSLAEFDSPELRDALETVKREASDESIFKGLQAYAACMLRRI